MDGRGSTAGPGRFVEVRVAPLAQVRLEEGRVTTPAPGILVEGRVTTPVQGDWGREE